MKTPTGKYFIPIDTTKDPARPCGQPGGYVIGPRGQCVYGDDDEAKEASAKEYFEELKSQWPVYILTDEKDATPIYDDDHLPVRVYDAKSKTLKPVSDDFKKSEHRRRALARLKAAHRTALMEPSETDFVLRKSEVDAQYFAKAAEIEQESNLENIKTLGALE